MKRKTLAKIASAALAVSMLAGTGIPAYAAVPSSKSTSASQSNDSSAVMKEALAKVKKRVDIPEELSEFSYGVNREYSTDCFTFTWSAPESNDSKKYETIRISIVGDIITAYGHNIRYKNSEDDPNKNRPQSFAKLSDKDILAKAKGYLKMLNPAIADSAEYSISNISLFGNSASVGIKRKVNGAYVDRNTGSIIIDKDTGELYSCMLTWYDASTKFESAEKKISLADAKKSFEKLCDLKPVYRINTNWETNEKSAVLVYQPDFSDEKDSFELDAFTGKPSTIEQDMSADGSRKYAPWFWTEAGYENPATGASYTVYGEEEFEEDDMAVGAGAEDSGSFTEAEIREIETDAKLLKKEEITKLLQKDKYIALPEGVPLEYSSLYKGDDGEYYYSMTYSTKNAKPIVYTDSDGTKYEEEILDYYINLRINAGTGKIMDFSKSTGSAKSDTNIYPVAANAKIAEAAMKAYYSDICGEYKADKANLRKASVWMTEAEAVPVTAEGDVNVAASSSPKKHYETSRNYIFDRYVNDVRVDGDRIEVSVNNAGEVTRVYYRYSKVKFPSAPKLNKEKAFEKLWKQQEMKLFYDGYYKKDGTVKTYLVYFTNDFTLDRNYKLCSYNGTPIEKKANTDIAYTDLKGSKYEKAVETLQRYGITLPSEGGKFEPNKTLTDKEFAALIYGITRSYVPYYIKNGEYKKEEKAVTLTNALAAKVFIDITGGSDYAELKGIYRSPFSDVPESNKYIGYIALAKAKGFMHRNAGKFEPDKKLSRGQAMQIACDYIEWLNKAR